MRWLARPQMSADRPTSTSSSSAPATTASRRRRCSPARGLRVLCLEKNAYVGGMAGTREILTGCRNDVGASLLFPLAKGLAEELELARYGVEFIDLPIMASNLNSRDSPPAIFYSNPLRMALYVLRHFGVARDDRLRAPDGVLQVPGEPDGSLHAAQRAADARRAARAARRTSASAGRSSSPSPAARWISSIASCPTCKRHRTLRALVAFAAVQSTYKGPFTPGSALCLVYTFAQNEGGGLMRRVKGGMGSLSEALCRSIADKGGEVRLKTPVRRVLIEDGRAAGVELRDGQRITARAVLSNLDKPATFFGLVGREHLDAAIDRADRAHRASRRLHAPALQAAAPAALRSALRAPERRSAHALQHDARARSRAPAGELRGLPARRGARASARRHADPDGDGSEPRARRASTSRRPTASSSPARRRRRSAAGCATRWPSGSSTA